MSTEAEIKSSCERSEEINAYLDGELDDATRLCLEQHLKDCFACAGELRDQRRLIMALDLTLFEENQISLPANFTEVVTAHAETNMKGFLRTHAEHKLALLLCMMIALVALALLGGAAFSESVLTPIGAAGEFASSIFGFIWHTIYRAGGGLTVILRALACRYVFESNAVSTIIYLLLALTLALLSRLIFNYHRTRPVE